MEIRKIRQLAKLLHAEGLEELELQDGESFLRIKKAKVKKTQQVEVTEIVEVQKEEPAPAQEKQPEGELIPSPLAGTFYRCKSPGVPPFVTVGEDVAQGHTLCILEAMKLMNELEAPYDCKIVEILVEDAQTVSEGQPIFRVIPS